MTRTYGSGTMTEVRPGTWRFRVYAEHPVTGQSKQVSKTIHTRTRPSKKALTKQLADFVKEVNEGKHSGEGTTVGALLDDWLADLKRVGKARTTLETYESHVEKRIRPVLGDVALSDLTPHRIALFYGTLKAELAPGTIRLIHSVLRGALSFAVSNGWLMTNPSAKVALPALPDQENEALTPEEVASLIAAAHEVDPVMETIIALAAVTGARRGELCGLRWSDVDWEAETTRIERAWVPGKGGQHLTTTKTREKRTVSLRGYGMVVLEQRRDYQLELWGELGEWLFSDGDGSDPLRAKTVTEVFSTLAADKKVQAHFHDLRHFASTQLTGLTDVKTAAARHGHSAKTMLETYSHAIAERDQQAAVALGAVLAKAIEDQVRAALNP
jgi:integrase